MLSKEERNQAENKAGAAIKLVAKAVFCPCEQILNRFRGKARKDCLSSASQAHEKNRSNEKSDMENSKTGFANNHEAGAEDGKPE